MQISLIAATCLMLVSSAARAGAVEPPNIILINIDDLGYGDTGPFGSEQNSTPHLDRMSDEGRRLTSHYAAPVCSPSRASMMTGCYPKRALPIQHVLFPSSAVGLHPEEITIAEVLKKAGYVTQCVGKWHLGDQPEFLPTRQGFDGYFGLPYSNDMGPASDGVKNNPGSPKPKRKNRPDQAGEIPIDGIRGAAQPPLPLLRDMTVVERVLADGQTTITRRYTEEAVQFIRSNKGKRFFLYLPHSAVHFPLYPGLDFRGKSGQGLFSDWVSEVDWSVGQVLETVRSLNLEAKTMVIFTSDNGGAINHGASNAPLRGSKGQTWEGGIRVPTIVWWPGVVPEKTSTSVMSSHMDWLPTFATLAGVDVPDDRQIDGVDLTEVLMGHPDADPRKVFHYFRGFRLEAVRQGPWKLHLRGQQLFNLETDISESDNVARAHPQVVGQLRKLAEEMDQDLGNEQLGPGARPRGEVNNPQPLIDHDGNIREGFEPDE